MSGQPLRSRSGIWIAIAAIGGLALVLMLFTRSRLVTARVSAGPVFERIVARGEVVPSAGVRRVFADADGSVVRVLCREGEAVELGQPLLELALENTKHTQQLLAPERGVVLGRHVEPGDYVASAAHGGRQPLFELADPTHTELRVEVEESDAASLAPQLEVTVHDDATRQQVANGRVERVAARLERRTIGADDARVRADGLVRVAQVRWTQAQPAWLIGARAEAIIEVRQRTAATRVPRSALSVREGRAVVEQPGAFWTREVPVEVLSVDDAYAEVKGIALNSQVIIEPAQP